MLLEELRLPWDLEITSHESDYRYKTAKYKLIISNFMSFVCSDPSKKDITREKVLAKFSVKHLFQSFSGYKEMLWKF